MSKGQTPLANPLNELLGAGAIYFNYDTDDEIAIGATKGGSTFNVEREYYESEQDGAFGPVKGDKVKISVIPTLTINAMELMPSNVEKFYAGMEETRNGGGDGENGKDYIELRERLVIEDTDYLENVAFVGETKDKKEVVIILENPLGDGETDWAMEPKENVVPEVQFTAHFDRDTPHKIPYTMRFPKREVEA